MSYVLRHGAEKEGIQMNSGGYIRMDDLLTYLQKKSKRSNLTLVHEIVDNNEKKRYEVMTDKDGLEWIRAAQGHTLETVKTEELLTKIEDHFMYQTILHGTYRQPLPLILKGGLNKMARQHIHMALAMNKDGVISGMRNSCQIVVEVNMDKAAFGPHKIPFYISSNDVVLSPGYADTGAIPAEYFRSVLDLGSKQYVQQAALDYICVYDFECQCTEGTPALKFNEIIEFPVVVIDVKAQAIKSVFHTYVKPVVEPKLTEFCTQLTGISQD